MKTWSFPIQQEEPIRRGQFTPDEPGVDHPHSLSRDQVQPVLRPRKRSREQPKTIGQAWSTEPDASTAFGGCVPRGTPLPDAIQPLTSQRRSGRHDFPCVQLGYDRKPKLPQRTDSLIEDGDLSTGQGQVITIASFMLVVQPERITRCLVIGRG